MKALKEKVKRFVKHLLEITRGKSREEIDQILGEKTGVSRGGNGNQAVELTDRLWSIPL